MRLAYAVRTAVVNAEPRFDGNGSVGATTLDRWPGWMRSARRLAPTVSPFTAAHLPAAAQLLADAHRAGRQRTPLLPTDFAAGLAALALVDATWRWPGATALVALDGAILTGFLIGLPGQPDRSAPHAAYIPASGYAVRPAGAAHTTAALYAALATRWHHAGHHEHHLQIALTTPPVAAAWRRLGFIDFLVLAASPLPLARCRTTSVPVHIRQATDNDTDVRHMMRLQGALRLHHTVPPISLADRAQNDADEHTAQRLLLADPRTGCWLAFHGDEAVGLLTLRPPGTAISPLHLPPATIHIVDAVTLPVARGGGVASALCDEALGWAAVIGYQHAALHVHAANQLGWRFWQGRGFTPIAQQLVRRRPTTAERSVIPRQ